MKREVKVLALFVFLIVIIFSILPDKFIEMANRVGNLAGIFFVDSITSEQLLAQYRTSQIGAGKVKILVVPGHDDVSFGTIFNGLKESDLNLVLAKELVDILSLDNHFEVYLSRDESGFNPLFEDYFVKNRKDVEKFRERQIIEMAQYLETGAVEEVSGVTHNRAPIETALRLYALNKWSNENGVDIVVHIHFNDYPRRWRSVEGDHSGYAIYIPEKQFSNAKVSRALAEVVAKNFDKFFAKSDLPKESEGIIEDQQLVAIGANNTLDSAALLVEYGYIYESQFQKKEVRGAMIKELALQTYIGIKNFFNDQSFVANPYNTFLLPRRFDALEGKSSGTSEDVLALQMALLKDGVYPPTGRSKTDCPLTGNYKSCTKQSVKDFNKKYGFPESVSVEQWTAEKLGELFGIIETY